MSVFIRIPHSVTLLVPIFKPGARTGRRRAWQPSLGAWHSGAMSDSSGSSPATTPLVGAVGDAGTSPLPFGDAARDLEAVHEVAAARHALLAEIGKRIVGQEQVIDHLLVALFARGHCLFVGVPGPGQDAAHPDAVGRAGAVVRAHPVHARSHAGGHHRNRRARGGPRHRPPRVPLRARADLRQRRARRRGEPHAAEDAGRPAPVDAGVPGDGGRTDVRAAAAVSRLRHAEPHRAGGDLSPARGAARSLHVPDRRRLPLRGGGGPHRQPGDDRLPPGACARCCRPSESCSCKRSSCAFRPRRTSSSTR